MNDYFFNGYYGYRNIGDDVFCVVADWGSRKFWGAQNLSFLASSLPQLANEAECIIPTQKRFPGHQTVARVIGALSAKNMIYFGGSTLHSEQAAWVSIYGNKYLRRLLGKNMAAVGVSIGPFRSVSAERATKRLISEMCFVSVRDAASFAIMEGMGVKTPFVKAFDLAVLMKDVLQDEKVSVAKETEIPVTNRGQVLGVSVCRVESYTAGNLLVEQARIEKMKAVLRGLRATGVRFRFFEFNGHSASGDRAVTAEVIAALDGYSNIEMVPYNDNPREVINSLSNCDLILGVRLHAAILAYTVGVPFLLVEYHRKCSDFLDEIQFAPALRIGDATASATQIIRTIESVLNDSLAYIPCGLSIEAAKILAMKNFSEAPFFSDRREKL